MTWICQQTPQHEHHCRQIFRMFGVFRGYLLFLQESFRSLLGGWPGGQMDGNRKTHAPNDTFINGERITKKTYFEDGWQECKRIDAKHHQTFCVLLSEAKSNTLMTLIFTDSENDKNLIEKRMMSRNGQALYSFLYEILVVPLKTLYSAWLIQRTCLS